MHNPGFDKFITKRHETHCCIPVFNLPLGMNEYLSAAGLALSLPQQLCHDHVAQPEATKLF